MPTIDLEAPIHDDNELVFLVRTQTNTAISRQDARALGFDIAVGAFPTKLGENIAAFLSYQVKTSFEDDVLTGLGHQIMECVFPSLNCQIDCKSTVSSGSTPSTRSAHVHSRGVSRAGSRQSPTQSLSHLPEAAATEAFNTATPATLRASAASKSTIRTLRRADSTVKFANFPPIVFGEERRGDIADAVKQLRTKWKDFMRGRDYGMLPHILLIAVSQNVRAFYAAVPSSENIPNDHIFLVTAPANSLERLRLARAYINIARWAKGVYEQRRALGILADTETYQGTILRTTSQVRVNAAANRVEKITLAAVPEQQDILSKMYTACAQVPHLERCLEPITAVEWMDGGRAFKLVLEPVGVRRNPGTPDELFLAIRHVLTALCGMHEKGFVHNDVRWDNIITRNDGAEWYLIDCEYAWPVGEKFPYTNLRFHPTGRSTSGEPCDPQWDLIMLARLLTDYPVRLTAQQTAFAATCLNRTYPSTADALQAWEQIKPDGSTLE